MTTRIRTLQKPPIREAVLDIKVEYVAGQEPSQISLEAAHVRLETNYPKKVLRRGFSIQVPGVPTDELILSQGIDDGFLFKSEDETRIVQFRVDGVTLNKLPPYDGWDASYSEVMRVWGIYVDLFRPARVSRIAARYINDVPVPNPLHSWDQHFQMPLPSLPYRMKSVEELLLRTVSSRPEDRLKVILTIGLASGAAPGKSSVLLDIDAFVEGTFEPAEQPIREAFQTLHRTKNEVFFSILTEKALEQFS